MRWLFGLMLILAIGCDNAKTIKNHKEFIVEDKAVKVLAVHASRDEALDWSYIAVVEGTTNHKRTIIPFSMDGPENCPIEGDVWSIGQWDNGKLRFLELQK